MSASANERAPIDEGGEADVATRVRGELSALGRLASPLILTNLGNMALALVDVAVVGRLGETAIAAAGLGNAIFFTTTLFGLGVLFGLDPLLAQAIGAKEPRRAARALVAGTYAALMVSVPLSLIILALSHAVPHLGAPAEAIESTRDYLHARVVSLAPFLLLMTARAYLQAVGKTSSLVLGVVIANVVNLPVAWILTIGVPSWGIEGHGVLGAGLASAIATTVQLLVSAWPLLRDEELRVEGARAFDAVLVKRVLELGSPIGFQIVLEAGSFAVVTFVVGGFGTRPLSGHQIALSVVSCTFQVALGISAATSVRVGTAIGRGDVRATRLSGLVGIASGTTFMIASAIVLFAIPRELARALTDDAHVIEASLPFMFVAACFQLGDGAQTVAQGALRGAGDTRFPLFVNLVGHWLIGLPLGFVLLAGLGPEAMWWGLSAGLFTVATLATARFVVLTKKAIARV
ncbi:MAG: MATE family efflux transporter [Sandaracinaceae bacterium]|nr:MATE family efflux transporter [Sandaracinaceae bacterium]